MTRIRFQGSRLATSSQSVLFDSPDALFIYIFVAVSSIGCLVCTRSIFTDQSVRLPILCPRRIAEDPFEHDAICAVLAKPHRLGDPYVKIKTQRCTHRGFEGQASIYKEEGVWHVLEAREGRDRG
jgi:hypothetical protein